MKNKKIVLLAMCFVSVVLCSTTPQKNSGYSYENSFEETIARALNLDYYSLKNGYSIKNGECHI